ncbi:sugar phosphorylase [Mycobacterium tuberculosis]|nr:sugar phosphorylase [Mycobacterium tuberculosis]
MITEDAFPVEPWQVRETKLNLNLLAQSESLFALSNGHIGLRGNLDEGEPFGLPGTYLNLSTNSGRCRTPRPVMDIRRPARPLSTSPTARSFACWSATSRSTSGMAN